MSSKVEEGFVPEMKQVVTSLEQGFRSLDGICRSSGLEAPKVQSALLRLTLTGHIEVTSTGQIKLVSIRK
jgi:predicted Rossmann fold nucleotide-binding protein DprA/Smf involved in DNA uptake